MSLEQPSDVRDCVYFTRRSIGNGRATVWVLKEKCPKCGKALMSKPKDPKTGKAKIRSKEYICPECGHTEDQKAYEEKLTVSISYTCPHCSHDGEAQVPFKRKKVQLFNEETQKKKAADAIRFQCEKCSKNIDITK